MSQVLHGGCLCGAVAYRVTEPFLGFVHCHCSRCRKSSRSAHASNLRVGPDQLAWLAGKSLLVRFDLPSARSFATTFCSRCGSPLPHLTRSGREVIVPAGSLNDVPAMHPQGHVYWDFRAGWTCGFDDLARFAEGLPGETRKVES